MRKNPLVAIYETKSARPVALPRDRACGRAACESTSPIGVRWFGCPASGLLGYRGTGLAAEFEGQEVIRPAVGLEHGKRLCA